MIAPALTSASVPAPTESGAPMSMLPPAPVCNVRLLASVVASCTVIAPPNWLEPSTSVVPATMLPRSFWLSPRPVCAPTLIATSLRSTTAPAAVTSPGRALVMPVLVTEPSITIASDD